MSFNLQVTGLDQIIAKFRQAQQFNSVIDQYITQKGNQIIQRYKSTVPVRTGQLKGSISGSMHGNTFTGGHHTDYGDFVEFGTSRMPAHHNLTDAYNETIATMRNGQELARLLIQKMGLK